MYIMRLDDASQYMDLYKWKVMENILDTYDIKPIVGIIPNNQDPAMVDRYKKDNDFWAKAVDWQSKGWTIALHGYTHVYSSNEGGLNPVNFRSEFAGIPLSIQLEKIQNGIAVLNRNGLTPTVFFAPSHTFDNNTLNALRMKSHIRVISDTIANDVYKLDEFYFVPQQSGKARRLPFKVTTFCYHPNQMTDNDFSNLESFIIRHRQKFFRLSDIPMKDRRLGLYDRFLRTLYFRGRLIRAKVKEFKNGKDN